MSRTAPSSTRRVELLDAELLRHAREELEQRAVRDRAAQLRVHLGVDRPRVEEALDEPRRRAVGEPLELRHVERQARAELLEDQRMGDAASAAGTRRTRAVELPLPAVRARERVRLAGVARGELGERAQPLALGRRVVERPRERRQRPPARPAAHVVGVEERLHVVPERARLARRALVVRRLADEVEALATRACTPCRRGSGRGSTGSGRSSRAPRASSARRASSSRNGDDAPRRGRLPSSSPSTNDDVEAARAGAQEVDDRDAAGLVARASAAASAARAPRRRPRASARRRARCQPSSSPSSRAAPRTRAGRAATPRRPAGRRRRTRSGASAPRARAPPSTGSSASRRLGERRAAARRAGSPPPRRRAPATGSRARAGGPRRSRPQGARAREGRAQVREQVAARRRRARRSAAAPRAPAPNGVCASRTSPSIAYGNAERAERGLERRAPALDARTDDPDALRRRSRAHEREQLLADELERAARAGALEEADGAVDRRPAAAAGRRRAPRSRCASAGCATSPQRGGSSSIGPAASRDRSSAVRRSDAKAGRPGSYGSETVTSVRPASASSSDHSAPVRSSKPYAKTGSPCHASSSERSRSTARRRSRSRSQSAEPVELGAVGARRARRGRRRAARGRAAPTRPRRAPAGASRRTARAGRTRARPSSVGGRDDPADEERALRRASASGRVVAARDAARRRRRTSRSCRRAAPAAARAARARRGRRPPGSAR